MVGKHQCTVLTGRGRTKPLDEESMKSGTGDSGHGQSHASLGCRLVELLHQVSPVALATGRDFQILDDHTPLQRSVVVHLKRHGETEVWREDAWKEGKMTMALMIGMEDSCHRFQVYCNIFGRPE